jgi:hypothetical protein
MAHLDLDARRAARAEKAGPAHTIRCNGTTFDLPTELPLVFVEHLNEGRLLAAVRALVGERADEFVSVVNPSLGDLADISELYGKSLGESSASTGS